jgi:FeS assembly protein IscX
MSSLTWDDAEDIGLALFEKFPVEDPLAVRFTDLRRRVLELDEFEGDPQGSSEGKLEAIQMAWYEEWKESQS